MLSFAWSITLGLPPTVQTQAVVSYTFTKEFSILLHHNGGTVCGIVSREMSYVGFMLNKNTWGVKKCGANQKQHCKQAGATKRFDIS